MDLYRFVARFPGGGVGESHRSVDKSVLSAFHSVEYIFDPGEFSGGYGRRISENVRQNVGELACVPHRREYQIELAIRVAFETVEHPVDHVRQRLGVEVFLRGVDKEVKRTAHFAVGGPVLHGCFYVSHGGVTENGAVVGQNYGLRQIHRVETVDRHAAPRRAVRIRLTFFI